MHTPSSKIEEDMKFLKVLTVKQFSGKTWKLVKSGYWDHCYKCIRTQTWTRIPPKWPTNITLWSGEHAQSNSQDLRRYDISKIAKRVHRALFEPLKQILSDFMNFFPDLHTYRTSCEEQFLFWRRGLIRLQFILKKIQTELNGPQCTGVWKSKLSN
jgi:hypothetical protein